MELSFVVSALRRRFWVVTLLALLGSLPGLLSDPQTSSDYESTARLSVQPPTRASVNVFSANPDRYVVSQLSVLESQDLAEDVAERITLQFGEEISIAALRSLVKIEQVPESDIVEITTTVNDAQKAAAISQAYVELYVDGLATTDEDQVQKTELEQQIATLENELEAVNQRLTDAMAVWLPTGNALNPAPIPPLEAVDASAVSQRALLEADLAAKNAALNELEQESRLRVNTEVISNAPIPLEPLAPGGNYLLAGGLLAGAILGVVVAMMWARFSTKVLDELSVGDIIGAPVVSELPHFRSLARNPLAAFQALPRSAIPTVDQLCVRAEALARIGEPLTVLVAGTMRSAGSTTLALAMAERFAAGGGSVAVVDADVRDPRITALFNATADGGVPSVIASEGTLVDQRGRSAFTRTMDPAVSVLGLGPNRGSAALRRDTVPVVLHAAKRKAEIVVVDGGPVLDLASTLQFAALADAVVLAIPLSRQKADDLTDTARQLEAVRAKLLPVVTSPSRRSAKGEVVGSDGAIAMPGLRGVTPTVNVANQQPAGVGAHLRPGGGPGGPSYADPGLTQPTPAGGQNPQPNPGAYSNPGAHSPGAHSNPGAHSPGAHSNPAAPPAGSSSGYQGPSAPVAGPQQPPPYGPPPQASGPGQQEYPSNGTPPVLPPGAGAVPPDHGSSG
jgi:Mrp family chromosome partitioning ATPase